MRAFLFLLGLTCWVAGALAEDWVFYNAAPGWKKVTKTDFGRLTEAGPVADFYTVKSTPTVITVVRTLAQPGWTLVLTHRFKPDGSLFLLSSELRTMGLDQATGTSSPTRCLRRYIVRPDGQLQQLSQRVTDVATGTRVERTFAHPTAELWMNLSRLPLPVPEG